MIRKLARYVKEYKWYAILTPIVMIGEVLMEVLIPFVMADIIDKGIADGDLSYSVYCNPYCPNVIFVIYVTFYCNFFTKIIVYIFYLSAI